MPLPVGLQKVVSSEELASSSRESQSRVLLYKLATGGAVSWIGYQHLSSLRNVLKHTELDMVCCADTTFNNNMSLLQIISTFMTSVF